MPDDIDNLKTDIRLIKGQLQATSAVMTSLLNGSRWIHRIDDKMWWR